jgi:predicted MFS family arabinose efflux permease
LFALAGVAGAISSPLAGRAADRGWSRATVLMAIISVAAGFLITHLAAPGSALSLGCLVAAGIMIDFGVQANAVVGQRALFALGPEYRSRLNGLFIAAFFTAGAVGSSVGAWAYVRGGWMLASAIGLAFPLLALVYALTEPRKT